MKKIKKDIGSIFPLYDLDLESNQSGLMDNLKKDAILFSLCREALYVIGKSLDASEKVVMLPAYTCDSVITPFKELGWRCEFYPVNLQLRIDVQEALDLYNRNHVSLMVVHPYYGKDLNKEEIELLFLLHQKGCKIVVDLTQCIFSSQRLQCVDYYVGSCRKWYPIPDGGFLEVRKEDIGLFDLKLDENGDFVTLQRDAMYLRGLYFTTGNEEIKSISRRLNKLAVEITDYHITPHKMSAISYELLKKENIQQNQKRRLENYEFLHDELINVRGCQIVCDNMEEVTSAPLYFMIYISDRSDLQRKLAEQHIYAPVIWPVVYDEVLVSDTIRYIYDNILAIPVDQRYDESDMRKIVEIIKGYYE